MVQYGTEQRFYLNNISIQLKRVSSDRKDKCVYSIEPAEERPWEMAGSSHLLGDASWHHFIHAPCGKQHFFEGDNSDNVSLRKVIL